MDKKPFPFDPFVDSLIGEKILELWVKDHKSKESLLQSLLSSLDCPPDSIFFTPNSTKQVLMVSYPKEIRKNLELGEKQKIVDLLYSIAKGNSEKAASLEISLELIEWLMTGFDEDEIVKNSLSKIFGLSFSESFVDGLRAEYIKEMRG